MKWKVGYNVAVKAIAWVDWTEPEVDSSLRFRLRIWAGANFAEVFSDSSYDSTATATAINSALQTFVAGYIQSVWGIVFNPILDSVKLINPISLL